MLNSVHNFPSMKSSVQLNEIVNQFEEYFEIISADTDPLKEKVFRLRYQVYCTETKFEQSNDFPDQLESDCFDTHSVHSLIRHRRTDHYAATTRLILPFSDQSYHQFPMELNTQINKTDIIADIPRQNLAEASRFCVSKEFKKRKIDNPDTLTGMSDAWLRQQQKERRTYPHITIALFSCLIRMSFENDIKYWYAVMEPALIRYFKTLGIHFVGIGPLTDYHGSRMPCFIKVTDLLNGVYEKNPAIWFMMSNKGIYTHELQQVHLQR